MESLEGILSEVSEVLRNVFEYPFKDYDKQKEK